MNDYKELIVHIATVMALEDECGQKELADMLEKAALAIDQLVNERDAAVAALKRSCSTCINEKFCVTDIGFPIAAACVSSDKCNWKWHGVQEVSE